MQQTDYYYGQESEQYTFYRLPKILFTDARFKNLSDGAKILYGLMLDRMGLSQKNGWVDEYNRVFIYFTLEDVQEYMACGRDKAMKMLAELDSTKGVGLIERMRQGQGKPTKIFLKKYLDTTDFKRSEKSTSGSRENRPLEVEKTDPNNTDKNKTDINNSGNLSYPSIPNQEACSDNKPDGMDGMDTPAGIYIARIKENFEYGSMVERYGKERMDEVVELVLETMLCTGDSIHIAGSDYDPAFVKERMLKINALHLEYAFDCLDRNTSKIRNIKAYILTALWNAPATIDAFYRAQVRHDMYGS